MMTYFFNKWRVTNMQKYNVIKGTVNGKSVEIYDPIYSEKEEEEREQRYQKALQNFGREMVKAGLL